MFRSLQTPALRNGLRSVASRRTVVTRAEVERLVSHILVKEEKDIDDIISKIRGGSDFGALAKEFSQCPSGKSSGGSLGWVSKGQMVKPFEEATFSADMAVPVKVQTQFGWHTLVVLDEREPITVQNISANELVEMLANPGLREDVLFVDVREQSEWDTAKVPGFVLKPLQQFPNWAVDFILNTPKDKEIVCLCHHGMRSMNFAQWLIDQDYTNVKNVTGGIDAVSRVDNSIPRY